MNIVNLFALIANTFSVMAEDGGKYVTSKECGEDKSKATSFRAFQKTYGDWLASSPTTAGRKFKAGKTMMDKAIKRVELANLRYTDGSSFSSKIWAILNKPEGNNMISEKEAPFICYICKDPDSKFEAAKDKKPLDLKVGEEFTKELLLISAEDRVLRFGPTKLLTMKDADGKLYTAWSSSKVLAPVIAKNIGKPVILTGTLKNISTWQGVQSTVINLSSIAGVEKGLGAVGSQPAVAAPKLSAKELAEFKAWKKAKDATK